MLGGRGDGAASGGGSAAPAEEGETSHSAPAAPAEEFGHSGEISDEDIPF
jgi:hypothetical protein